MPELSHCSQNTLEYSVPSAWKVPSWFGKVGNETSTRSGFSLVKCCFWKSRNLLFLRTTREVRRSDLATPPPLLHYFPLSGWAWSFCTRWFCLRHGCLLFHIPANVTSIINAVADTTTEFRPFFGPSSSLLQIILFVQSTQNDHAAHWLSLDLFSLPSVSSVTAHY